MSETYQRSGLGVFTRLIGVSLLLIAPLIIFSPELFNYIPKVDEVIGVSFDKISINTRLVLAFILILKQLILVVGLFSMARLFDCLSNKNWILNDLSKHLRRFGLTLIFFTLSHSVVAILLKLVLGSGKLLFAFSISSNGVLVILVGFLLVFLARVLLQASKNAEELEQIV